MIEDKIQKRLNILWKKDRSRKQIQPLTVAQIAVIVTALTSVIKQCHDPEATVGILRTVLAVVDFDPILKRLILQEIKKIKT